MELKPLSDALGVEVSGVDISKSISAFDWHKIYDAWIDATVVLFRSQRVTEDELLTFARRFGPVKAYNTAGNEHERYNEILVFSNLTKNGKPIGAPISGQYWHTDGHFLREPPSASVLYAIEVPPVGGDTWFANMFKAYDALPDMTKRVLEGRRVLISRAQMAKHVYPERPPMSPEEQMAWPDMPQPLVRTHPVSGRKALYVGGAAPWRVEGLADDEAVRLVTELQKFAVSDRFTYVHKWRGGDVIVWDNRCTLHRATSYDLVNHTRHMQRVTIMGDIPR